MASWPKVKKVGSGGGGSSESTTSESGSEGKLPTPTTDSIKNNNIDRSHNKSNSNSNQAERFEYFSWVYHLGVNSIGREYRHFRFLFIRGKYVEMYKRDPRENPGIKPIRRGVIGNTLMVEELGRRKVNDHDFYVLKFYNRLDETKKGERQILNKYFECGKIAFATAGDARKCMEAFYHAKQQNNMILEKKMDDLEHELSKIVGLEELKLQLRKLAKGLLMDEKRRDMGLNLGRRKAPHMTFLGNPGTGKTTVARVLGKLLHSVGVLSSNKVIEVQRSDLVSNHIGETALKTRKKIAEAMGGVLFVDEAYRLAKGESKDWGVEALEEIMSVLEDDNLVVIFAGYTEPMKRVFSANEGFCRRVTNFFQFDDFTCNDLAEMLLLKMNKQDDKSRLNGFKLHPSCTFDAVSQVIEKNSYEKLRNKMNGGLVDHMLNNARENLDSRLNFNSIGDEVITITLHDLEAGLQLLAHRIKID